MKHISEYIEKFVNELEGILIIDRMLTTNREGKETDQERTARLKAEAQKLIDNHGELYGK